MVFLRLHMALNAFYVGVFPTWIVGNAADIANVGKPVAFQIGFRHHKQAVDIAQLVKTRIVRIMGGAHRVDVVLFHQHDVALNPRHINRPTFAMIVVMAVNAVQFQVAPVDVE
ncbi:hypothetical protein D3C81_1498870 [compost metagenome]